MLTSLTVSAFIDETASASPAPGGGSISALAAAAGTALLSMVCRLTIGKKKYADVQSEIEAVLARSETLRVSCTAVIDEDTDAFNRVMAAYRLPKETGDQQSLREKAVEDATKAATLVPLKLMEYCLEGLRLAAAVSEKGNKSSASDAGVAALMLQAACKGAALNVGINLQSLHDEVFAGETKKKADRILSELDTLSGK